IGLAVSVGVKIMTLYLLIGLGMSLSNGWVRDAVNVPTSANPAMSALEIVGSSLIFGALCLQAPKLMAGVMGGSPALTGADLASPVTALAAMTYFGATTVVHSMRALAGRDVAQGSGAMSAGQAAGLGTGGQAGGSRNAPTAGANPTTKVSIGA